MDTRSVRGLFATSRVARLATLRTDGSAHLVPICFALDGDTLYTAVDHKPKRTTELLRLANIQADPRVCVLADHYAEDWSQLWWARADGLARIIAVGEPGHARAVDLLVDRYPQYRGAPLLGTAIAVEITRWTGWSSSG
jgi:PPOX class probable F420-dependent enzyme